MPTLVYYKDNKVTRIMTSSLPKSKWQLTRYGLDEREKMKLLEDEELPTNFRQHSYSFDGETFTPIEPEPIMDYKTEILKLQDEIRKLKEKK